LGRFELRWPLPLPLPLPLSLQLVMRQPTQAPQGRATTCISCAVLMRVVNLGPCMQALVAQKVFVPVRGGLTNEDKVKDALAGLEKTLDVLDQRLASNQYLAGGHPAT
jgi:glutathione S-transferase